jgi:alcohol dehydrogenase class IV
MYGAPHGAICAALLAPVCAANIRALLMRAPAHPALPRYAELARILTGEPRAGIEDGVEWLQGLRARLAIPGLGYYGFRRQDAPLLVAKAQAASSMKANPLPLTDGELHAILEEAS